jgi:hypothetical protein
MKQLLLWLALALAFTVQAQPDTLYVPLEGGVRPLAVVYGPRPETPDYVLKGHYAYDTSLVAVELAHRNGRPCGVYRAYFPDGRPLIFAVYGYDELHGDWSEYDDLGRITVKGQYRDGKRDGTWAFRGEGIVGHYRKGERHGRWKYYVNGRLVRIEKYHRGTLKSTNAVGR